MAIIEKAYKILEEEPLSFLNLFEKMMSQNLLTEEQKAFLYNDLNLDHRFIFINGKWDLSNRYTYAEILRARTVADLSEE